MFATASIAVELRNSLDLVKALTNGAVAMNILVL